jgi:site-specific DNA-methyltransferase (adenine-specific)
MLPGARRDAVPPSRFFYTAKASRSERNSGLDAMDEKDILWSSGEQNPGSFQSPNTHRAARNFHPTVKPIDLMRYLCRMITPPNGLVLDPFAGSGSTGVAAKLEGFHCILIEKEADYVEITKRRLGWAVHQPELFS